MSGEMTRKAYEPCEKHRRTYCSDSVCKREERDNSSSSSDNLTTDITTSLLIGPLSPIYTDPGC